MADNYLEKRYEEVFGAGAAGHSRKRGGPSLNTLLVRNRSTRRFRTDAEVSIEHLRTIVEVNTRIASALNRQTLRFGIVRKEDDPEAYERLRDLYVHGQDWRIPPSSFIVVFSTLPEGRFIDIDLGISLQSMSLKAVELGLNATIVGSFDRDALCRLLDADNMHPLALLAVGKGCDKIQLLSIREGESHAYYRKEGIHYVPKLGLDELIF